MEELETKCKDLRVKQDALSAVSGKLNRALEEAKDKYMAEIKAAVRAVADGRAEIHNYVDSHRDLFDKSRSQTMHGIRVGLQKGRGVVECDDETKAIAWIRSHCEADEVDVLVRTSEKLNKTALADVEGSDLKKMGVQVIKTGDKIFIKDVDSEVEKLIASMLKEKEKEALANEQ